MEEFEKIYNLLVSFLGESKNGYDRSTYQYQFPCPRCIENYGENEARKFNLEVNLKINKFNCWKCGSEDGEMHGSISKLIRRYGNEQILKQYQDTIRSLIESDLYKIHFKSEGINLEEDSGILTLPKSFRALSKDRYAPSRPMDYLRSRGIGWDIIEEYEIGCTGYDKKSYRESNRIYIPSYDKYGNLNYYTGRDFADRKNTVKYLNPNVDKKDIIFNEGKIQWDADITLVEGPFDHIVVPNSIPLLGKILNKDFKLYWDLLSKAKANILIFLDSDAYDSVIHLYSTLNHGRLYNRIRYIPLANDYDPSLLYQRFGKKGIIQAMKNAVQIKEEYLFNV